MPSEMEIILSFNECVLKLHDMSGAKDIMVKKIHMVLTFFLVSRWWKRHITSLVSLIYIWENLGYSESRCQGTKPRPGDSGLSILLSNVLSPC